MRLEGFTAAVVLALLPAAGNLFGGLLAEVLRPRAATLSYALHAAAGAVLAVVGLELMPAALDTPHAWVPILAFVAGAGFFLVADSLLHTVAARFGATEDTSAWMIYLGVAVDLFSDGVMIGTGATVATGFALLLALGQVPADVPEGLAVVSALRDKGVRQPVRMAFALALGLPVLAGSALGYLLLRDAPELARFALLAFTGGLLTTVVIEELVPEAHREGGARFAAFATVGGFALFAAVSRYAGAG